MSLIYSPGPAAYNVKSTLGDAPKHSLRGRRKEYLQTVTPGPGTYKAQLPALSPQYTMRAKTKLGKKENTPGLASITLSYVPTPPLSCIL